MIREEVNYNGDIINPIEIIASKQTQMMMIIQKIKN